MKRTGYDTKDLRKELNMSQAEFALQFNISPATVKNWDARQCMPEYVWKLFVRLIATEKAIGLI